MTMCAASIATEIDYYRSLFRCYDEFESPYKQVDTRCLEYRVDIHCLLNLMRREEPDKEYRCTAGGWVMHLPFKRMFIQVLNKYNGLLSR
jgi:hypothetical protein